MRIQEIELDEFTQCSNGRQDSGEGGQGEKGCTSEAHLEP